MQNRRMIFFFVGVHAQWGGGTDFSDRFTHLFCMTCCLQFPCCGPMFGPMFVGPHPPPPISPPPPPPPPPPPKLPCCCCPCWMAAANRFVASARVLFMLFPGRNEDHFFFWSSLVQTHSPHPASCCLRRRQSSPRSCSCSFSSPAHW